MTVDTASRKIKLVVKEMMHIWQIPSECLLNHNNDYLDKLKHHVPCSVGVTTWWQLRRCVHFINHSCLADFLSVIFVVTTCTHPLIHNIH